jgi:DNA-binding transcriptional MerR regulator
MYLLKPSYINYENNYRYYDYDKIEAIKIIMLLKSLHIPLADIKKITKSADQIQWNNIFEQKMSELEKQKQQITIEIEEVKQMKIKMAAGVSIVQGPILSDCYFENWEDKLVYSLRKKVKIKFIDTLVKGLFDQVYAYNLKVHGNLMAIFHNRELKNEDADVELLIPIKDSNDIDGCKILAKGKYACITVKVPYTGLEVGYEVLKSG